MAVCRASAAAATEQQAPHARPSKPFNHKAFSSTIFSVLVLLQKKQRAAAVLHVPIAKDSPIQHNWAPKNLSQIRILLCSFSLNARWCLWLLSALLQQSLSPFKQLHTTAAMSVHNRDVHLKLSRLGKIWEHCNFVNEKSAHTIIGRLYYAWFGSTRIFFCCAP